MDGAAVAEFTLAAGQETSFVLERITGHDDDSPYARRPHRQAIIHRPCRTLD